MTESMIYWITRLDGIHSFFLGLQVISTILTAVGIAIALTTVCLKASAELDESSDEVGIYDYVCKLALKVLIPAFCIAMTCSLARTFMPTTKEMIAIKVIPQIASVNNVEKIKDVSEDMLDITTGWLKDMRKKYVNE